MKGARSPSTPSPLKGREHKKKSLVSSESLDDESSELPHKMGTLVLADPASSSSSSEDEISSSASDSSRSASPSPPPPQNKASITTPGKAKKERELSQSTPSTPSNKTSTNTRKDVSSPSPDKVTPGKLGVDRTPDAPKARRPGPSPMPRSRVSSSSPESSRTPSGTRATSAYVVKFGAHLIEKGITINCLSEPRNFDEIKARLTMRRPSSPSHISKHTFKDFRCANHKATSESEVKSAVMPSIIGSSTILSGQDIVFRDIEPFFDATVTRCNPDHYDGSDFTDIHSRLRGEFEEYIVPSARMDRPCLPNFFIEVKGPAGDGRTVQHQAAHCGVIGARGIHKLRSYVDHTSAFDDKAYTIVATYAGGPGSCLLTLYTVHPVPSKHPEEREVDYHMTQLRAFALTDSREAFYEGTMALQNARQWAQEQRKKVLDKANAKAKSTTDS